MAQVDPKRENGVVAVEKIDRPRGILENYGNMSSATILFLIQSLTQNPARLPLVPLAFGPGLTIEAALFDLRSSGASSQGTTIQFVRHCHERCCSESNGPNDPTNAKTFAGCGIVRLTNH